MLLKYISKTLILLQLGSFTTNHRPPRPFYFLQYDLSKLFVYRTVFHRLSPTVHDRRPEPYIAAPSKRIHEGPGFWIPASRFQISASGFWIPTLWIPNSNLLDSGFHTKAPNNCGFRILTAKNCWIPDSLTWGDIYLK